MSENQKRIIKALLLIQQCKKPSDMRMVGMNLLMETETEVKMEGIITEEICKRIEERAWDLCNGCSDIYCLLLCSNMESYMMGIVQSANALRKGVEDELAKRGYNDDNKKRNIK